MTPHTPRLRTRRGFALPMAILVIAVISAGLTAAYAATNSEITTNSAQRSQNRAYNIAQTGLEQFMVRRREAGFCTNCVSDPSAAAVDSEWTRVTLPDGYADVVAVKVRPMINDATPAIYFIRSRGRDTTVRLGGRLAAIEAERTVGVYATFSTITIKVISAWTSLNGLEKNGTGTISGVDACGEQPDVAGVTVPKGDLETNGNVTFAYGTPTADTSMSLGTLKNKINIDWAGIIAGTALTADVVIPGDAFPSASAFTADPDYWPVIRVKTNNYSLPNAGRGIIIADSNFVISGSNMWDGIVLVGGRLTSNGNNTTAGATLSGLNYLTGGQPPEDNTVDDSDANGQKTYVYDSCNVENATSRFRAYIALPNTWVDNVPVW